MIHMIVPKLCSRFANNFLKTLYMLTLFFIFWSGIVRHPLIKSLNFTRNDDLYGVSTTDKIVEMYSSNHVLHPREIFDTCNYSSHVLS